MSRLVKVSTRATENTIKEINSILESIDHIYFDVNMLDTDVVFTEESDLAKSQIKDLAATLRNIKIRLEK